VSCPRGGLSGPQYVGDPVDVTTGANIDVAFEFSLEGTPAFIWRRYYNSTHHRWRRALGWGHTHEYDHDLRLHIDGVSYRGPQGEAIEFGGVLVPGGALASGPYTLLRRNERTYVMRHAGVATQLVFEFPLQSARARLVELRSGTGSLHFRYGRTGLEEIALPSGRHIVVSTDAAGCVRALSVGDRSRRSPVRLIGYEYDEAGNVVRGRDQYGGTFAFQFDAQNRMVRRTNRNGYSTVFSYDGEGRCVHAGGEDGVRAVALRYDPLERSTTVTEADGGAWTYFYDEGRKVTLVLNPLGGAQRFLYSRDGVREAELDPLGNVTRWVYDGGGGLVGKISPIGLFYEPDEPPPRVRPHLLPTSPRQYEFGKLNGPNAVSRDGALLHRGLGPELARLLTDRLPTDSLVSRRDDYGKLLSQTQGSGAVRHWGYDANGNMTRYRDFSGAEYRVDYASWNHRVRDIDPEGGVVEARFTKTEKLEAIRDAGGSEHRYQYDALGQVTAVYSHGELLETYERDLAGNLVVKRDRKGDPLLRLDIGPGNLIQARQLSSGDLQTFAYDPEGRILQASSTAGDVQFAYDEAGGRTKDVRNGRGVESRTDGPETVTTVLGRFVISRRQGVDGTVRVMDCNGGTHRASVVAHDVMHREHQNGSCEYTRFDSSGRVHARVAYHQLEGRGRWVRTYQWSDDGDLLEAKDNGSGVTRFTYDRAHRLRAAVLPDGTRYEVAYDLAGNLLRAPGLASVELVSGNRLARANGDRFEYDERDRMARREGPRGTTRYSYDSRGMLVRVETDDGSEWEGTYDPIGRRVTKTAAGGTTEYFWRTDQLAAEVGPDGRLRVYVYWDSLALTPFMFVDYESVDAEPGSGSAYYVFSNHLGAPLLVEDEAGRPVWRCTYSAYGSARIDPESTIVVNLRFPGHYFDAETGLHYNRFRYYSPELGRYLQCDPEGIAGGLNPYAYTDNPLAQVDIRGLNCGEHGRNAKSRPDCEDCLDDNPVLRRILSPTEPGAIMSPARLRAEVAFRERVARAHMSASKENGRGPCFSMVLDQETGQAFPGTNRPGPPENLHPLLADRVANPPPGGWRNQDPPASHSEIHALNDALWAREARRGTQPPGSLTDTSGLLIDNQRSTGANRGSPMPCCPNCTHITGDIPSQAGKDPVGHGPGPGPGTAGPGGAGSPAPDGSGAPASDTGGPAPGSSGAPGSGGEEAP
jgi:RHS repeat-associated protein